MKRLFKRQTSASYKYTLRATNLLADPSTAANILTVIPADAPVTVVDAAEDWYQVTYNDQTGYVETDDLSLTKYTWKQAFLRPFATSEANPIGALPAKTEVQVLSVYNDWSQVIVNNQKGYIFSYFLTDDGNPPEAYNFTYFYTDMQRFVNDNQIKSPTINLITTDLANKLTYVFEKNGADFWDLLFVWSCTVGKPSTPTIIGTFYIDGRKPYFGSDTYRVKYATRILGSYYYHSILFNSAGTVIINDQLGEALSHGCIRLAVENAQWIYDNILDTTAVVIN